MASLPVHLRRTPLHPVHAARGAKLVPFGGWDMPVQYASILEEHHAVRQHAGLFDISHMGQLVVTGSEAEASLNRLLTNDLAKIVPGQAQYTFLCNENGGIIDDLIAYRVEPTSFLLVVNAGNTGKDIDWMQSQGVKLSRLDAGAVALQGPAAAQLLPEGAPIPAFQIRRATVGGTDCWVARTGYTGEDGFEIMAAEIGAIWHELVRRGAKPCGLGARDTLRLEACLPLHGQDISEQTTPLEAGLGRFVSLEKPEFVGRAALVRQREQGVARKLVAFRLTAEKCPPPRPHYPICIGDRTVGEVTSGTLSPTLGVGIGMGYVEAAAALVQTPLEISVRGKRYPAIVEPKPFYKRGK